MRSATSKSAVSPTSQSAGRRSGVRVWKPATWQTWKSALRHRSSVAAYEDGERGGSPLSSVVEEDKDVAAGQDQVPVPQYVLLHALFRAVDCGAVARFQIFQNAPVGGVADEKDRKSTRLNSS